MVRVAPGVDCLITPWVSGGSGRGGRFSGAIGAGRRAITATFFGGACLMALGLSADGSRRTRGSRVEFTATGCEGVSLASVWVSIAVLDAQADKPVKSPMAANALIVRQFKSGAILP